MTLKEKFKEVLKNHFQKNKEEDLLLSLVDEDNEKIADEFAIGFAEWVNSLYVATDHKNKTYKQLLQIYKKEKGL